MEIIVIIKKRYFIVYSKKDEINAIKIEYDYRKNNNLIVEYIIEDNNKFSFDLKAGILSKMVEQKLIHINLHMNY